VLRLSIGPSRYLLWLLILAHAGAVVLLWLLALPVWVKSVLTLAVIASLVHSLRHVALLKAAESIIAIEIKEPAALAFQTRRGEWHECSLSGDSYVSAWLTIVILKIDKRRFPKCAVITPDNVDAEDFRRLRVWLRWNGGR
jgi:toxin CptA